MSRKDNAAKLPGPLNDYTGVPPEVEISDKGVGRTFGTTTGEEEHTIVPGGWQGTDDATSTAPSDQAVPPAPENHAMGEDGTDEDPTGRAYGGGLSRHGGGVSDLAGKPVEESRDWDKDAV